MEGRSIRIALTAIHPMVLRGSPRSVLGAEKAVRTALGFGIGRRFARSLSDAVSTVRDQRDVLIVVFS